MAKWVSANVLDGALSMVGKATRMIAINGQPADYAGATGGALAATSLASGDFRIAAGVGSGRKVTIAAKANLPVSAAGTVDHVALVDDGAAQLLYVTTCPPQLLAQGGTVNFAAWNVEIGAPL